MRYDRGTPGLDSGLSQDVRIFEGWEHPCKRPDASSRSDEDYRTSTEYATVWSVYANVASVWDQGSVYLAVARPRQAQIRDETVDVLLRSWVLLLGKVVCLDSRKRVLIRSLLSKNSSPRHVSRRCQQRRDRRK